MTLASYLCSIKKEWKDMENVVYVCGNEATDLDSTSSAISFAFTINMFNGSPLVPFINCASNAIIKMRGELELMLGKYNISVDDLLFRDDVLEHFKATHEQQEFPVILVDHNVISGAWKLVHPSITPKVLAIIDHHVDEHQYLDASPRIVRPCGSNATLLLEYLDSLHDPEVNQRLDQVKSLLVTAIVFDTLELTWRDDPLDHKWAGKLFGMEGAQLSELQKQTRPIMAELDSAIIPETNFSYGDLLYKDYKLYTTGDKYNYGISVLRTPFQTFLETQYKGDSEAMAEDVKAFMTKEHIRLFAITLAVREPGSHSFYQQLGIWCFDGSVDIPKFRAHLLSAGSLSERVIAEGDHFGLYYEDNQIFSRKKLQPVFQSFLIKDNLLL